MKITIRLLIQTRIIKIPIKAISTKANPTVIDKTRNMDRTDNKTFNSWKCRGKYTITNRFSQIVWLETRVEPRIIFPGNIHLIMLLAKTNNKIHKEIKIISYTHNQMKINNWKKLNLANLVSIEKNQYCDLVELFNKAENNNQWEEIK